MCKYDSLEIRTNTIDYPVQPPNNPDYIVPDCDQLYFSLIMAKIVKRSMTKDSIGTTLSAVEIPQSTGQLSMYVARLYSATESLYYRLASVPASMWNTLGTQTQFYGLRTFLNNTWINSLDENNNLIAPMGRTKTLIMDKFTGYKPCADRDGYCLFDYLNNPGNGPRMSGFFSADTVNMIYTVIPSTLIDFWLYNTCRTIPKCMQIWPRPNSSDAHGLVGSSPHYGTHNIRVGGVSVYTVPTMQERFESQIRSNELPIFDETEVFNNKLAWAGQTGSVQVLLDGTVITDTVTGASTGTDYGHIVVQQYFAPDFTTFGSIEAIPQASFGNNYWYSPITETGESIFVANRSTVSSTQFINKLNGTSFFSINSLGYHNREILPLIITSAGKPIMPTWMKVRAAEKQNVEIDSTTPTITLVTEIAASAPASSNDS